MKTTSNKLFSNKGFGWVCEKCEINQSVSVEDPGRNVSRLMREGEAESPNPKLSNASIANWADQRRKSLICPICDAADNI